jgi:hypothetical protein
MLYNDLSWKTAWTGSITLPVYGEGLPVGNTVLTLSSLTNAKEVLLQFGSTNGGRNVTQMKFEFIGTSGAQVQISTYDPGNTEWHTVTGCLVDNSTGEIRAGYDGGSWSFTQTLVGVYYK